MTKEDFLKLLGLWSSEYDRLLADKVPGFGTESSLDDWLGSIEAFAALLVISNAVQRAQKG